MSDMTLENKFRKFIFKIRDEYKEKKPDWVFLEHAYSGIEGYSYKAQVDFLDPLDLVEPELCFDDHIGVELAIFGECDRLLGCPELGCREVMLSLNTFGHIWVVMYVRGRFYEAFEEMDRIREIADRHKHEFLGFGSWQRKWHNCYCEEFAAKKEVRKEWRKKAAEEIERICEKKCAEIDWAPSTDRGE